jgi:hypothetical protein
MDRFFSIGKPRDLLKIAPGFVVGAVPQGERLKVLGEGLT